MARFLGIYKKYIYICMERPLRRAAEGWVLGCGEWMDTGKNAFIGLAERTLRGTAGSEGVWGRMLFPASRCRRCAEGGIER